MHLIKTSCIFNTCTFIIKVHVSVFMLLPCSDKVKSTGLSDPNQETSTFRDWR